MNLHEAAAAGDLLAVEALLARRAKVDRANEYGHTPLMEAASQGRTEVVTRLLAAGADARRLDSLALDFAVRLGNAECVGLLLDAGADPNRTSDGDPPPLHDAVARGNRAMVERLLAAGARPDVEARGAGLLALAAREAQELFDLLEARGASTAGALAASAAAGRLDLLDRLLDRGVDVEEINRSGCTPLARAAEEGQLEAVERLLAAGADPDRRDEDGRTPLGHAVRGGHVAVARALLDAGAGLDADPDEPLLALAVWLQGSEELVRLLLGHGADPEEAADGSPPPLFQAVESEKPGLVAALLEGGADPDVRVVAEAAESLCPSPAAGATPLHLAALKGTAEVVALLFRAGADPSATDAAGRSPADCAAEAGHAEVAATLAAGGSPLRVAPGAAANAALLRAASEGDAAAALDALDAGADPNAHDPNGRTALLDAARHGLTEVVRALLDAGADPDATTDWGESPLRHAALRSNAEVVGLLLDAGADVGRRFEPGSVPADPPNTVFFSQGMALHDAVTYGTPEVVERLLTAGADPNAEAAGGTTPLLAAVNARRMDMARRLIEAGAVARADDHVWLAPLRFADAAEDPAFRALAAEVADACGSPAEPIDHLPGALSFRLTLDDRPEAPPPADPVEAGRLWGQTFARDYAELTGKAEAVLERLAARARAGGFLLLDAGKPIGCGPMTQFLALLPTADTFEAIAAFGVRGNDQELSTAEIIDWLRQLVAVEPFDLRGVRHDTVDMEFRRPVADPDGLAQRLVEFCHDLDDAAGVARRLRDTRRVTLWWD